MQMCVSPFLYLTLETWSYSTCPFVARCYIEKHIPGLFTWELSPRWNPGLGLCMLLNKNAEGCNASHVLNSQESGLKVNQPASFAIRLNGAKGKIDAKVHSPSGAVEECHVSELEPGKQPAPAPGMFLQTCILTEGSSASARPSDSLCCCQTLFIN